MKITGWANARITCNSMKEVEQKQKELQRKGYNTFGLIEVTEYGYFVFETQISITFEDNKTFVKPL